MNIEWSDELISGIHDEFRRHAIFKLGTIIGNFDKIGDVIALYIRIDGEGWINARPTSYKLVIRSRHENGFILYYQGNIDSMHTAKQIAHDKVLEMVGSFIEEVQCNLYKQ
jgi:hypothetical protein